MSPVARASTLTSRRSSRSTGPFTAPTNFTRFSLASLSDLCVRVTELISSLNLLVRLVEKMQFEASKVRQTVLENALKRSRKEFFEEKLNVEVERWLSDSYGPILPT